jgi:hypothetical protein
MLRSPLRAAALVFLSSFLLIALIVVIVTAVTHHNCLVETRADPMADLPASQIPAFCEARFHGHFGGGLIFAGAVSTFIAALFTIWRFAPRHAKDLQKT